jgi:hypothetical protein
MCIDKNCSHFAVCFLLKDKSLVKCHQFKYGIYLDCYVCIRIVVVVQCHCYICPKLQALDGGPIFGKIERARGTTTSVWGCFNIGYLDAEFRIFGRELDC